MIGESLPLDNAIKQRLPEETHMTLKQPNRICNNDGEISCDPHGDGMAGIAMHQPAGADAQAKGTDCSRRIWQQDKVPAGT